MEAAQEIYIICKCRSIGLSTRPQSHCFDFVGLVDRLSPSEPGVREFESRCHRKKKLLIKKHSVYSIHIYKIIL